MEEFIIRDKNGEKIVLNESRVKVLNRIKQQSAKATTIAEMPTNKVFNGKREIKFSLFNSKNSDINLVFVDSDILKKNQKFLEEKSILKRVIEKASKIASKVKMKASSMVGSMSKKENDIVSNFKNDTKNNNGNEKEFEENMQNNYSNNEIEILSNPSLQQDQERVI